MLQTIRRRSLFSSLTFGFALVLAACNSSHGALPSAPSNYSYARDFLASTDAVATENKECVSTRPVTAPYVMEAGAHPSRCELLSTLASGQPAVFVGVDIPQAQAMLAVAEGQPQSEVVVPPAEYLNVPLHYIVVQRSQTGPPLLLESIGFPLNDAIAHARNDAEQPNERGSIGNAWFPVLRSELRVNSYTAKIEKTSETKNFCLFCLPPGVVDIRCPNALSRDTSGVTYYHNVYRLISAYRPDDFYLADAWAVRPHPTNFEHVFWQQARMNAPARPFCEADRVNLGLVNHYLNMAEPLAVDARTHATVGNLYEWAPETRPQKWEYRLYLGTDSLFAKKGFPLNGLSASYEITWTVEEFSVKPQIHGFVATDGEFNTDYSVDFWPPRNVTYYPPARGPFQATSSYEQGFTTKIPSPQAPEIYQHLYFPYKALYEQLGGLDCAFPLVGRVSMSTCDPRKDWGLNVDSRPLVTDPVLGFQAAANAPYKYKLDDVCVVQRDHGVNPVTTLRLISQQFSPATPIPVQFSNSGGGHIDPDFVAIEPVVDEKTFVIHVRLNAGKKAIINDRRTFDVETKPQHVSPSTRYNPVRFTVTIRTRCP